MPPDPTGRADAEMLRVLTAYQASGAKPAIYARDKGLPAPVHELLVYPVVGTDLTTPSYKETEKAVPLNRTAILWYVDHFTNGPGDLQDKRLNVIAAATPTSTRHHRRTTHQS